MIQEPEIKFSQAFKGGLTLSDLLASKGALTFIIDENWTKVRDGYFFEILHQDFVFSLGLKNNSILIKRNDANTALPLEEFLEENKEIRVIAMWSHDQLILECMSGTKRKTSTVPTKPTVPPAQLITWTRKHKLLPVETYSTEEEFREKIHASLVTINQKIREADAYKSFWNVTYEGNKIRDRQPKKEVEIQPLIHCFLSDQMLLGNIEIVPEYKTGEGNLDFLFIGQVVGLGMCKFCAEFKLAHSDDLVNGLLNQLPKYMDVSNATYGAYCVLDFRGDWFNQPKLGGEENLELYLHINQIRSKDPVHDRIRWFVFDLAKPITASKKP